jgi:hypothetical protein
MAVTEAQKRWRSRNKEQMKINRKKAYASTAKYAVAARKATPEGWAKATLPRLRYRARKAGLEFDLRWEDIVPPTHCPVMGMPLQLAGKRGQMNWHSPSVDRFDNSFGYTRNNVRVISNRANILKKDASLKEIRQLLAYMGGG